MSNTPKLRFKEFDDEWNIKKLGDLGEFKKTYSFSRSVEGDGKYKHIHYGDIHMNYNGVITKEKLVPTIDIPDKEDYIFIEERDIIFADASEDKKDLGKVAIVKTVDDNTISGLHTICFKPNMELNSEFFLNHSLNKEYLKFMYTKGVGAKVLGISKSNLMNYEFLAPSLPEQEKIANFLSLIDRKIELQEEKLNLSKEYKKGMMQKIFSQELRFKDENGGDYPEWEEKKLGELIVEFSKKTTQDNEYTVLSSTLEGIRVQEEYFSKQTASSDTTGYKIVPRDYFTYRSMSDTGVFKFNIQDILDIGIVSPAYPVFKTKNFLNNIFFKEYLNNSTYIKKQLLALKEGGTRYALSIDKFKKIKGNIPSLPEQEKIANFLSKLDEKIDLEQEKLDLLKEYKKGLLQQMFV